MAKQSKSSTFIVGLLLILVPVVWNSYNSKYCDPAYCWLSPIGLFFIGIPCLVAGVILVISSSVLMASNKAPQLNKKNNVVVTAALIVAVIIILLMVMRAYALNPLI